MISPARPRGICQACRRDIQLILNRGFCAVTATSITRATQRRRPIRSRVEIRSFSHGPYRLSTETKISQELLDQLTKHTLDPITKIPTDASVIDRLEEELGRTIEEAIEDDETNAEVTELLKKRLADLKLTSDVAADGGSGSVVSVQRAGNSSTDIAREARQKYGDILPTGLLNDEELSVYRRLYGEPQRPSEQRQTRPDSEDLAAESTTKNQLYSIEGEEIEIRPHAKTSVKSSDPTVISNSTTATALKTTQAREVANALGGTMIGEDEYDEFEEEEEEDDDEVFAESDRAHPLTTMGRFKTNPKTIFLSQEGFVKPVESIMSNYSNKHLKEMCEKTFGGPGLPDSPLTPRSARSRQQVPIPLDVNQNTMGEMEANAFITTVMPPTYASVMSVLYETRKRLGSDWLTKLLAREGGPRVLDAGAGGAGIIAWREVVQAHWESLHTSDKTISQPPATKAVVVTGSDGLRHRAADMLENTTFIPRLPDYVHTRDTPTLEDNRPSQQRKQFDVIIAPHALFGLKEDWMRKQHVQNLWSMLNNDRGVLILIEKGVPRGFEAIAGARDMLLERYLAVPQGMKTHYSASHDQQADEESIHKKGIGMIVAPCTNHEKCPMYTAPGLSRGRKDICSFQQRYIRPAFLQRVLGAKDRNHDDVDFSYLSVMKGDDLRSREVKTWDHLTNPLSAPFHSHPLIAADNHEGLVRQSSDGFETHTPRAQEEETTSQGVESDTPIPTFQHMPRIVYPPIKRRGHVTMDLCTPAGKIERWTIPRSYSKQAYRDARKSKWGDLWALGAKTQIARNMKLGTPDKQLVGKDGEIIKGKGRGRKERLKIKAMELLEKQEEEAMDDLMEQRDMMAAFDEEMDAHDGDYPATSTTPPDAPASTTTAGKPMNNRARKAAKRALRSQTGSSTTNSGTADLSFKPQRLHSRSRPVTEDVVLNHNLAEWSAELDGEALATSMSARGKKGRRATKVARRSREREEE